METNVNNTTEPQHDAKLPVSSSSSSDWDWRNDEYNNVDDDFYEDDEHNHEAENCHCGAYKWTKTGWLHVSDCCC